MKRHIGYDGLTVIPAMSLAKILVGKEQRWYETQNSTVKR